jgi:hypothetical protein
VQITTPRRRLGLACAYELMLLHAEPQVDNAPDAAALGPCPRQVLHARSLIRAVTIRLGSTAPVNPQGVAQLRELIWGASGPCAPADSEESLSIALEQALRSLEVHA